MPVSPEILGEPERAKHNAELGQERYPTKDGGSQSGAVPSLAPVNKYRVTTHELLSQTISALRLRVNQLEALQRSLPIELPYVADEALRQLIVDARRG